MKQNILTFWPDTITCFRAIFSLFKVEVSRPWRCVKNRVEFTRDCLLELIKG